MATLNQFSNLVSDIYDAALDPDKRRRPHIIAASFDPVQKHKYNEYYSKLDPLAFILEEAALARFVTSRKVINETQRRGEFYADWAYPNETGDTIFVNILAEAGMVCTFMMGHPWCSEPFATPEALKRSWASAV